MAEIKYGLTEEGFRRKRLADIRKSMLDRLGDSLGVHLDTGNNSVVGQLFGVIAYEIADLWEQAENTYNAMYPTTASGESLSQAAALAGITPEGAKATVLLATCYGQDGAKIPYGAQIASSRDAAITFSCTDTDAAISANAACEADFTAADPAAGDTFSMTIATVKHAYTARSGDKGADVLGGLMKQFSLSGITLSLADNVLNVKSTDPANTFSVAAEGVTLSRIGSPVHFTSDTTGAVNPSIGEMTQIVTAYTGWDAVSNNRAAAVGNAAETDVSLRQRWNRSVYSRGRTMAESIAEALYQVEGVTMAKVYENDSDETDAAGRPPHSIECIVTGGELQDICDTIWARKALGIDTYGSTRLPVTDSQGITHDIGFNRPAEVKIWIKVVIHENPDEVFAASGLTDIAEAILQKGQASAVGEDVILQKFYCVMYGAASGVGQVELTACAGEEEGTYTAENIRIDDRSIAVFDLARIDVTDADQG